ncbi:5'-3' exonuclease [Mycoplasmopsis caviae]|uniref:5'-3' exonuclease n=1 Tax=Mycoplasmopsis caviae TaxID=55603 RepID=A0A3P8MDF0_9BACT|nr:5'-3' exonuclease H3TH domain-containing protein [Mycoplasmopsis caviae]UUD35517.1 5'-3' exonuclease [Mycoplasmopsis caviae]VDR41710.1 DNA polymerase I [Mycoplasmopsis caviae]
MKKDKFLLIDGNYLLFSSFYASYNQYNPESTMRSPQGITTNGVHVFLITLSKLLAYFKPKYLFIAFDAFGKTKRHQSYQDYKAGRMKAPTIIFEQFKTIKEILTKLNIKWFEKSGDEADDLIATLAQSQGCLNLIFSKDKDLLQLVNGNTCVVKTVKEGFKIHYELETIDNFEYIYGIKPNQIPDFKGLAGDSSDNLKGVSGIGEKGAIKLINEYGSLENIYQNIDQIKGKTKDKLTIDKEQAYMCKSLATLNLNVEMDKNLSTYLLNFDWDKGIEQMQYYGLNRCAELFEKLK